MKKIASLMLMTAVFVASPSARADYCDDQFYKDMGVVSVVLSADLVWQRDKQQEAVKLEAAKDQQAASISKIISGKLPAADKVAEIQAHDNVRQQIQAQLDMIATENVKKNQDINSLKTSVPQNLVDKAKDCAQKVAPLNLVVNIVVQGLALFYTDGASVILPQKALYIDMGEIAHGNVMGGPHSAPNDIKNTINRTLGLHL